MKYDLERRALIARAKSEILATMEVFSTENAELTALEWTTALNELQGRMIQDGLAEEWRERLNSNRPG